jgi:hypothetical protein
MALALALVFAVAGSVAWALAGLRLRNARTAEADAREAVAAITSRARELGRQQDHATVLRDLNAQASRSAWREWRMRQNGVSP